MTGFDIIVVTVVGVAALGGLLRGFVHEVLALAAWVLAIVAIYLFHTPLTAMLAGYLDSPSAAAVLAFVLLLLAPYVAVKMAASRAGRTTRRSVLGPVDRVLGLGFGAVKGVIIMVMVFSLAVLGYDTIWGEAGRPEWLRNARTYAFINASSQAMVKLIGEQRAALLGDGSEDA